MNDKLKLSDEGTLAQARQCLAAHLHLSADGYCCQIDETCIRFCWVSRRGRGTLEAVCAELTTSPHAATIRTSLHEQLRVEELDGVDRRRRFAVMICRL